MHRLPERQRDGARESLRLFIPGCISHPEAIQFTELLPEPHILSTVMERAFNGVEELLRDHVDIPGIWQKKKKKKTCLVTFLVFIMYIILLNIHYVCESIVANKLICCGEGTSFALLLTN